MLCYKCSHPLHARKNKSGQTFEVCPKCKGLFASLEVVSALIKDPKLRESFRKRGLKNKKETGQSCPRCKKGSIWTGHLLNHTLNVEMCNACFNFYFDENEAHTLKELGKGIARKVHEDTQPIEEIAVAVELSETKPEISPLAPPATNETINISSSTDIHFNRSKLFCPICFQKNLFAHDKSRRRDLHTLYCHECQGTLIKKETMERALKKNLFAPNMFIFRPDQIEIKICQHCHCSQTSRNSHCQQCHRELLKIMCPACSAKMNEYVLSNVIIERCDFCSYVWLNANEYEAIEQLLPDDVRAHEQGKEKAQKLATVLKDEATRKHQAQLNHQMNIMKRRDNFRNVVSIWCIFEDF